MKDIMGIINLSESEEGIREMTYHRPIGTIPIAGRYRIIDFILSNMVNAGIHNVSIFTQGKSRSLMDHLGTGKPWDLDRKIDGLFVLNPVVNVHDVRTHKGDLENFRDHLDFIQYSHQDYVLLARSYMICNIDFTEVFKDHKEKGADITIIYKKLTNHDKRFNGCNTLNIDKEERVISIGRNIGSKKQSNISMEMYLMKKELFIEIIQDSILTGKHEYMKQAILDNIKRRNVNSYHYRGYLACINSIHNYYETNMDLLDVNISQELFHNNGTIYTKVKDEPPTKYTEDAKVANSLIANGCIIEGTIENSVVARGVRVEKGAVIKNSIIMQKSTIEKQAYVNHTILDKYVYVTQNKILSGDRKNPLVIRKGLRL